MSVAILEEKRDEYLKRRYLKKIQELGINDPLLLVKIADYLTPEKIAYHRNDMLAIVHGELAAHYQASRYKET